MTDTQPTTKKRPDYVAHAVVPGSTDTPTRFVRIGVGFTLKNGGISILSDAAALSGHVVLVGLDAEPPALNGFKHGAPLGAPQFVASMVREAGKESYWTDIGSAYRHDGYLSVHVAVWPSAGKIILTQPRQQA
jgi:hypothetical protein